MRFPSMLASRQDFAMFAFRAHNVVNARLSKPVYPTLDACMEQLKTNTATRTAEDYRVAYLIHIQKYWSSMSDLSGIVAVKKILEMRKIEADYFKPRDTNFNVTFIQDTVTIPRNWVDGELQAGIPQSAPVRFKPNDNVRTGFRVQGGRIRLF